MKRKAVRDYRWPWALSFLLLLVYAPVSAARPTLSNMTISAGVDMATMAPENIKSEFQDTVDDIWATAYLDNAPTGTSVSAKWLLLNQGRGEKLVENRITADGKRYVAFRLQPIEGRKLPAGQYQVDFFLNGDKVSSRKFRVVSSTGSISGTAQPCRPTDADDEKLVVSLAKNRPEIQKQLAALKLMRYSDPQGRFSLIVPGGWYQVETTNPNQVLFLSQNKMQDPILWFVVSLYNVTLTPKFSANDTLTQLKQMLLDEGKKHGVEVLQNTDTKAEEVFDGMATGNLIMAYATSDGTSIGQAHAILVDGQYAIDIQLSAEEDVIETGLFLSQVAYHSLMTERLCRAKK